MTTQFILNFKDKLLLYEKKSDPYDHFSDRYKTQIFQNSVHNIRDLHQVKIQTYHHKTYTRSSIGYQQYSEFILSASSTYNEQLKLKYKNIIDCEAFYNHLHTDNSIYYDNLHDDDYGYNNVYED